jgi:WD40 repeat protein
VVSDILLHPTAYQRQITTEVRLADAINAHWDSCISTIPIHKLFITTTFSHNGSALAVISDEGVKTFETAIGVATFKVDESAVSAAFSPDDDIHVCGFEVGLVKVLDVQTSNIVRSFAGHRRRIFSVVFSPCDNMVVPGSGDKTNMGISLDCCICMLTGHEDWVQAVCLSATGDQVISGSRDNTVRTWDLSRQTYLIVLRGHTKGVRSVASPCDASLVASGSWGWNCESVRCTVQ